MISLKGVSISQVWPEEEIRVRSNLGFFSSIFSRKNSKFCDEFSFLTWNSLGGCFDSDCDVFIQMCFCGLSGMLISPNKMSLEFFCHAYNWSSYSDLTRVLGSQNVADFREIPWFQGNQRLVKYYDLARCFLFLGTDSRWLFSREVFSRIWGEGSNQSTMVFPQRLTLRKNLIWLWIFLIANGTYFLLLVHFPASYVNRSVHHHVVWRILVFVRPCLPDTRRNQNE